MFVKIALITLLIANFGMVIAASVVHQAHNQVGEVEYTSFVRTRMACIRSKQILVVWSVESLFLLTWMMFLPGTTLGYNILACIAIAGVIVLMSGYLKSIILTRRLLAAFEKVIARVELERGKPMAEITVEKIE